MSKSGLIGLALVLPLKIASTVRAKDASLSGGSPSKPAASAALSAVVDGLPERTVGRKGPPICVGKPAKGNDTILGSLRRRQHNFGRNISAQSASAPV
jgi:hypothetical protein